VSTYSVEAEGKSCDGNGVPLRPLSCECCRGMIGQVASAWEMTGLEADYIASVWPALQGLVALHESGCSPGG
jgi:hypothetical protein